MSEQAAWDGAHVRAWLERQSVKARRDQDVATRHGRDREDEFDQALAREYVCRRSCNDAATHAQDGFLAHLKGLLAQGEHHITGAHDDRRIQRQVRACLQSLVKKAKTNSGFDSFARF
ncbi:hypothetical protein [Sphingomonas crocodyli]|uniref:Uncharacterized protein n=1 Tax=Sphingomonas crocodyli TaxID=1979270 RepID=A0A437LY22_9SPHN|nr:hypothetical protein [Sphingomonas crocodyli]RVT90319.1 hypothetical protein EOD43_18795 [Sphingomonas crocodyli]